MHSWLNNIQNVAFLLQSYFNYVMLTHKRYQALPTIHIHVLGEPGNEAKCITDLTLFCRGTFQLEMFWHLCVSMSANDTIHSLYLLHKPTIQHVAARTPVPKHSEDHLKKHEKLEYKSARLKVSVPLQLESASLNKVSQRNFFHLNNVSF